jgi:hypothetical protein
MVTRKRRDRHSYIAIYTSTFTESPFVPPQFFEKCLNELSLPHTYNHSKVLSESALAAILGSPNFGGTVTYPPVTTQAAFFASTTPTARAASFADTIFVKDGQLMGHDSAAKRDLAYLDSRVHALRLHQQTNPHRFAFILSCRLGDTRF